ncbi:MAG: hypothetical protein WC878_01550 [Candidatus Paceibacterota bacterium]|jgi:hypothetical protein
MANGQEFLKTRPVKDFLGDFKKQKLDEGENPRSALIYFLDHLIENIKDEATMTDRQEKELAKGIEWDWWCTDGSPSWYVFLQLLETLPK